MTSGDSDQQPTASLVITGRPPCALVTPVTIGRDPHADVGEVVVIDGDPLVSKSHLSIDRGTGGLVITDLGSSNGTFLHDGGREIAVPTETWIPVPPGAAVEFGDQRMTIEYEPAAADDAAADDAATPEHGTVTPATVSSSAGPSIVCARCVRELEPDARFCDGCGTPTPSVPSVAPVPPVAPAPPGPPAGLDPGATVAVPAFAPGVAAVPSAPPAPPGAPLTAPAFVDPSAASAATGGRWKLVVALLALLVGLGAVVAIVAGVLGGDDGDGPGAGLNLVPETVDERWSESVSGRASDAYVDDDAVYVLSSDATSERIVVAGFDRRNGDELWETTVDAAGTFADIAGGVPGAFFVTVCDAECSVVGIDPQTGDELWSASVGDGFAGVTDRHVYTVVDGTVAFLDPVTGDRLQRLRGEAVRVLAGHIEVSDGDDLEVLDVELNIVLGPEPVEDADAVAFDGDRLVIAEGDVLRFVDAEGAVTKESSVDVGLIEEVTPVADDNIVLTSDEGVISIDPIDGTADERWSARGNLFAVAVTDGGTVALVDDGGTLEVIDVDTGERRFDREVGEVDGGFAIPGRNALAVYRFESFDEPTQLSLYDWTTGDELWRERFDGFPILDGGLVVELSAEGDVVVYG